MEAVKIQKLNITDNFIIYCFLIILPIYKDSPLQAYLGSLGETLIPIVNIFGLGYLLLKRKVIMNGVVRHFAKLGIYLAFISYMALMVYYLSNNVMILYGEHLFVKPIKVLGKYYSYVIYLCLLCSLMHSLTIRQIFSPIVFTAFLLTGIGIVEKVVAPDAFLGLHFDGLHYDRLRLLTKEASWTTMLIFNYSVLSIFYALYSRNDFLLASLSLNSVVLIFINDSKSFFVLLLVVIFCTIVCLFRKKKYLLQSIIFTLGLSLLCYIFLWEKFYLSLMSDINHFTSLATRGYTIYVGCIGGLVYPFGVGGGVYLSVLPQLLEGNLNVLNMFSFKLNLSEIYGMISATSSDYGLTIKSGIVQYNLYWGVFGTIVLFMIFSKILKKLKKSTIKNKLLLQICLISNIVMLIVLMDFSFEFWLLIAVVILLPKKLNDFKLK